MTVRFQKDTSTTLDEIELYYDPECSWSRHASSKSRTASFGVTDSTNLEDWSTMPGFDAAVDNSNVTDAQTWFTNEEMNALAPSRAKCRGNVSTAGPPSARK